MEYKDLEELVLFLKSTSVLVAGLFNGLQGEDLLNALNVAKRAPAAIKDVGIAFEEYLKQDEAEKAKLKALFNADHPAPVENVEAALELGFGILEDLSDFVALLAPKPPAAA